MKTFTLRDCKVINFEKKVTNVQEEKLGIYEKEFHKFTTGKATSLQEGVLLYERESHEFTKPNVAS